MKEKEFWFERDGLKIYSLCYIPEGEGPFPTIILGSGFGASYTENLNCAERYANSGFAAVSMEFCGATADSKSDGKTSEMSVMTETEDMIAVFKQLRLQSFVDPERVYLWGESQGGYVAALAGARLGAGKKSAKTNGSFSERPDNALFERPAALILFYPAFSIQTRGWEIFKDKNQVTGLDKRGVALGPCYFTDIWDLDTYYEIAKYEGPVLILHGDKDDVVPIDCSKKALAVYKNAQFKIIEGAGHGFFNETGEYADRLVVDFLKSL